MSKEERDDDFWSLTDEFIQLANKQCDTRRNGKVSTSLAFSAARFNAFMYASTTKDLEEFNKDRDLAIEYFTKQFKDALTENLKDYEKNYNDYVGQK